MLSYLKSIRKTIAAVSLILLGPAAAAWATTAVVVITPNAIVTVIDTRTVFHPGNLAAPPATGSARKIFLIRNRFAIADVGVERLTHPGLTGEKVLFDFPTWVSTIKERLPKEITVTSLTRIVEDESNRVFTNLGVANFYDPRAEKNQATNVQRLAQFLVIGYENGIPRLNLTEYKIDWNRPQLIQSTEVVHPTQGERVDFGVYTFGQSSALTDTDKPQGQAHRRLAELVPDEDRAARSRHDLTPSQAVRLAAAFILIESEDDPTEVGFPVRAVTIPRAGHGSVVSYSKEALRLTPRK